MLLENGLDDRLAFHISSLFIRAPVPVYEKELMFPCCIEESDEEYGSPLQSKKKESFKELILTIRFIGMELISSHTMRLEETSVLK